MPETEDTTHPAPASPTTTESSGSGEQFADAHSAPRSPEPASSPKPNEPADTAPESQTDVEVSSASEELETKPTISEHDDSVQSPVETQVPVVSTAIKEASRAASPESDITRNKDVDDGEAKAPRSPDGSSEEDNDDAPTTSVEPPLISAETLITPEKEPASTELPTSVQPEDDEEAEIEDEEDGEGGDDDAFGDDFDDFEEGGEEEDFDDFDDGFQQPEIPETPEYAPTYQQTTLPFPVPDFDSQNLHDIIATTEPYFASLFPPGLLAVPQFPPLPKNASTFTTPRSASLWSQLVAPPPLAPPDWIRSRTRRLFLVSLGVPVDLDEILPASKQKKLILPSLNIPSSSSPRTSSDSRSISRIRQGEANASSTSVDTQGKPKRRKGPPPQPEFDMVGARHLCMTTDEALSGMTDEEVKSHVAKLESLQITAEEVLKHWQKLTDEKIAERETFEGVIENLVKHARKVRK